MSERIDSGIAVRNEEGEFFLPQGVAVRVAPIPELTMVPGAPREVLGVALHEGEVILVLAAGIHGTSLLVCNTDDGVIGLVGLEIAQFDVKQESLPPFNLKGLLEAARMGRKSV